MKSKWFVIKETATNKYLNKNPYRWVTNINDAMAFRKKDAKKELGLYLDYQYELIPVKITILCEGE